MRHPSSRCRAGVGAGYKFTCDRDKGHSGPHLFEWDDAQDGTFIVWGEDSDAAKVAVVNLDLPSSLVIIPKSH